VEGVDLGFFLRGFLLGFLLLGQQAQGEQVKVVRGGQAAGAFGVLGHGKHLLALVRAPIVPQRRGFA